MKKLITLIFISFMFIGNVNAETIEEQLNNLKNNYKSLKEEIDNLELSRLDKMYPIGSIFETTTYSSATQVSNALGGTWEAYGSGKTLIGVNADSPDFNTVNKTGGSSTTTLSTSNLPSHTHSIPALSGTAASAGAHTHSIPALSGTTNSAGSHNHAWKGYMGVAMSSTSTYIAALFGNDSAQTYINQGKGPQAAGAHTHTVTTTASNTGSNGAHTHSVSTTASNTGSQGSGTAFTNLQPYITVYMYKRVG